MMSRAPWIASCRRLLLGNPPAAARNALDPAPAANLGQSRALSCFACLVARQTLAMGFA
jgi:hypothetical protein